MNTGLTNDRNLEPRETLKYECEFPVLGKPVRFRTNYHHAMRSINSILQHWNNLPEELCAGNTGLTVDIVILDIASRNIPDTFDFQYRYDGSRRVGSCGENLLIADSNKGKAIAYVTPELLANELAFAWFTVESLALFLVTASSRVPFHASAVTRGKRGFAFIAKNGMDKSSLAYACLKGGFGLLAEDVIYVGTEPNYKIWGNATNIKLLPDTVHLFPELGDLEQRIHPNGELKISIPLADINGGGTVLQTESVSVCLLQPDYENKQSSLQTITPDYVREYIFSSGEPLYNLHPDELPVALEHLLDGEAYCLRVGHDLNRTAELLMDHL